MGKKGDFEKIFGTTEASKKNWDFDTKSVKVKRKSKKGKKDEKDLFGRNISSKKKNKGSKDVERVVKKQFKTRDSDAWLPINTDEISNLKELVASRLPGVFRIEILIDSVCLITPVVFDGKDRVFILDGTGNDIVTGLATFFAGGGDPTDTDISIMRDKLENGSPFKNIDCLNISLIIEI